jgi:hypothetical protein
MSPEQIKQWEKVRRAALGLRDGIGNPVDSGIIDTVAILLLMGFRTTSSCAGHPQRLLTEPYVRFESAEAKKYYLTAKKQGSSINNPAYRRLRHKAIRLSLREVAKLLPYLEDFYTDRPSAYNRHLAIEFLPPTYVTLRCQGTEMAYISDAATKTKMMAESRAEMKAFTEYLKMRHFQSR